MKDNEEGIRERYKQKIILISSKKGFKNNELSFEETLVKR